MNLAPLYRIKGEEKIKALTDFKRYPERICDDDICRIKSWCTENNWEGKFGEKYKISMERMPAELQEPIVDLSESLRILINETNYFKDASILHHELERFAWQMIEDGQNVALALTILFYCVKGENKKAENDYGSISVAFESEKLIFMGKPAVSQEFVNDFNQALLAVSMEQQAENKKDSIDAFGNNYRTDEDPMPSVKLAGGFEATIRTMFKEQRCQNRYGRIGNASYPISQPIRIQLKSALEWLGSAAQENITWIKIDKNEIMFAYPLTLPKSQFSYTAMFKQSENKSEKFFEKAKQFISELKQPKEEGTDSKSKQIRIFILRKIDKARTKVVYTRQTDADELEKCSEAWTRGCSNLPVFPFGALQTPYPMDAADILNRFWKQNGEITTDKFDPFPKYHGLELLMEPDLPITRDLYRLAESTINICPYFVHLRFKKELSYLEKNEKEKLAKNLNDMLAMLGLFLYREHIGKEQYMENLPYLYGQLLKAADELHALYCNVVRNGDIPPQFVGSSMFQSASEMPARTMQILSQRIMPYYSWAKSYRLRKIDEPGRESWRAGWLYGMCEKIMNKLQDNWTAQTRFNDEEKAQLFIGYLASFPKREQTEQNIEEEIEDE